VNVAWEVSKERETDVDEEVRATAGDEEDADRRDEDGYYDENECGDHGGVVCDAVCGGCWWRFSDSLVMFSEQLERACGDNSPIYAAEDRNKS